MPTTHAHLEKPATLPRREEAPNLDRLIGAGFRAFLTLADRWQITVDERFTLLGITRSTYYRWLEKGTPDHLPPDRLKRLSFVLGIARNLREIYGTDAMVDTWMRTPRPNEPIFEGRSPIAFLCNGDLFTLALVRDYLDAVIEGWA